jgi:superkiller protein 3
MELANKAFRESQNQDPGYIQGWVGQALLAEMTGCDSESMDLFRHATFLGNELESSIGYANWICKYLSMTDLKIESKLESTSCSFI